MATLEQEIPRRVEKLEERVGDIEKDVVRICADLRWIKWLLMGLYPAVLLDILVTVLR